MGRTGQVILNAGDGPADLDRWIRGTGKKRIFLVCSGSIRFLQLDGYFRELPQRLGIAVTRFSGFCPNPTCESVSEGAELFEREGCDMIVAVGGGSALDVAKCVRLCSGRGLVPFAAVPTTAGSGSEATRFAVIYRNGEKYKVIINNVQKIWNKNVQML